jgi:hypothetical protein
MKKLLCPAIFLVIFLLAAVPVRADIDQTCLRQCNGISPTACLAQCGYGQTEPVKPPPAAPQALPDNHNVVDTLTPIDPGNLAPPKPPAPPPPVKDYTCFNACVHDAHNSYGFCEKQCSRPACPPGGVLCMASPGQGASAPIGTVAPALKPPVAPTR